VTTAQAETGNGVAAYDDVVAYARRELGDHDRERIRLFLRHRALPKLRALGLVDYDPRSETIRYRGDPLVEALLDELPE